MPSVPFVFLLLFFFTIRPDKEILETFLDLLIFGKTTNDPKIVLSITAVAHTFCRNTPNCRNYQGIQDIIEFLLSELNYELNEDVNERQHRERVRG